MFKQRTWKGQLQPTSTSSILNMCSVSLSRPTQGRPHDGSVAFPAANKNTGIILIARHWRGCFIGCGIALSKEISTILDRRYNINQHFVYSTLISEIPEGHTVCSAETFGLRILWSQKMSRAADGATHSKKQDRWSVLQQTRDWGKPW